MLSVSIITYYILLNVSYRPCFYYWSKKMWKVAILECQTDIRASWHTEPGVEGESLITRLQTAENVKDKYMILAVRNQICKKKKKRKRKKSAARNVWFIAAVLLGYSRCNEF